MKLGKEGKTNRDEHLRVEGQRMGALGTKYQCRK